MSLVPFFSAEALMASDSCANRAKTALMSPPFSMEMMRQWSSSFTQASTVLESLWKMPRLSGQDLAACSHIHTYTPSELVVRITVIARVLPRLR